MSKRINRCCKGCNTEFELYKSDKKLFCTIECRTNYRYENVICNECGNIFRELKCNNRKFCSRNCSDVGRNKTLWKNTKYQETIRKLRLCNINYIEQVKLNDGQLLPNYNISSIPIIEQRAKELGITDLQHAENGGEFFIEELGYWVDGYSKEKNIVIEYYEKYHTSQGEKDLNRQNEITKFLNCEFIIINE